ncbi:hypothetical protein HanXRQr2_Chr13g0611801 [Helianthus annuus]|uniref:Uncharacterized protein n=1 Tax=Helianthus annuus TaxID=4232 RepID=A0A251SY33_HELAN|nr:hypothetical protein HanXRQr2_Chr13g0611801 [Helianthus annuus]
MDPVFHTLTLLPPPWLNFRKVNQQTHVVGFLSLGYQEGNWICLLLNRQCIDR